MQLYADVLGPRDSRWTAIGVILCIGLVLHRGVPVQYHPYAWLVAHKLPVE